MRVGHYNSFVQTVDVLNTAANTQGKDDFYMKMFDGFAEDSWKVRSNITLNVGVRYDVQLTPPPVKNNTNSARSPPYSSNKNVTNRIQPRIGFSWSPYDGTVVRGGYGLFSALNQGSTYYAMRVENGVVQINYNYTGCDASVGTPTSTCPAVPSTTNTLAYPNVPFQPTGPSLNGALFPTGGAAPAVGGPSVVGAQSFHGSAPTSSHPSRRSSSSVSSRRSPGICLLP